MTSRILTSQYTFAAGANADVPAKLDQTKLDAAIDGEIFTPFALVMSANTNITLTKVVLASDTNEEQKLVLMPDSANGVGISELNEMFKPDAGGIPPLTLKVTHGGKLLLSGNNSDAGNQTVTVLWKVMNQAPSVVGPSFEELPPGVEALGDPRPRPRIGTPQLRVPVRFGR